MHKGVIKVRVVGVITYFPVESAYIKGIKNYVDVVEIRGDIVGDRMSDAIQKFSKIKPVILTIRSEDEGGRPLHGADRKEMYFKFLREVDFIDVELSHADDLIDVIRTAESKRKRIILSYHNFERTPSERELDRIFKEFMKVGGDIFKVATFGRGKEDIVLLALFTRKISLQRARRNIRGLEICTMCMGNPLISFLSRLVLPIFGSDYVYGKVGQTHGSAPGQPDAFELAKLLKNSR